MKSTPRPVQNRPFLNGMWSSGDCQTLRNHFTNASAIWTSTSRLTSNSRNSRTTCMWCSRSCSWRNRTTRSAKLSSSRSRSSNSSEWLWSAPQFQARAPSGICDTWPWRRWAARYAFYRSTQGDQQTDAARRVRPRHARVQERSNHGQCPQSRQHGQEHALLDHL